MGTTPPPQTAGPRESASLVSPGHSHTANTRHCHNVSLMVAHRLHDICSHNVSLMLAHHLQPWLNSKTAFANHLIFAGGTGNLIH